MGKQKKSIVKKVLASVLAAAMLLSVCPVISMAADEYTVAWIGGSFTEGTAGGITSDQNFVGLVTAWMNETDYAGSGVTVNAVNAGVGGTTSNYGYMRYDKDVLSKNPDMVIIEFAGNDSIIGDYTEAINGMEGMIRRTIAESPETKIALLFRPSWNGNTSAKEYHEMVADYYNIPIITADEVPTDPGWVLEDGVHPNAEGHKQIAEYIDNWLENNEVKTPVAKQFPINPNYRPVAPVYKNAADLYDAEKSTGWTVDEEGCLVSSEGESKLYLNVKGSAISIPGVNGSLGYGSYTVDPYTVDDGGTDREGSRKRGSIAGGGYCQATTLSMGDGEHVFYINKTDEGVMKIDQVIVDAVAYGEAEAKEQLNYEVVEDKIGELEGDRITETLGGGKVIGRDYNYIFGVSDAKGLAFAVKDRIVYELTDAEKAVGSVKIAVAPLGEKPIDECYKVYAVNADNEKTELKLYSGIKSKGEGVEAGQGWYLIEAFATGIPADTVSLELETMDAALNYACLLCNVTYTLGVPTIEGIALNLPEQMLVGDKSTVSAEGIWSDNSKRALENADILYYSSDSGVAAVNLLTGEITAESAGVATIYAEATVDGKVFETQKNVTVYAKSNIENAYFEIPKTNYTVGTKGKISFVTRVDGVDQKDIFSANYSSSDENVVRIEKDGSFEAVGEGTANISLSSPALPDTFEDIVINVTPASVVEVNMRKDVDAGLVDESILNNLDNIAGKRHGTKLFGAAYMGAAMSFGGGITVSNYSQTPLDSQYMLFVYKLDEELESLFVDAKSYSTDKMQARTKVAYLTDENITFTDAAYPNDEMTLSDERLTGYGLRSAVIEKGENGADVLRPEWIEDDELAWEITSGGPAGTLATSSKIPEGAKYAAVWVNSGKLPDGTEAHSPDHFHFCGVELRYAAKIAAGERTQDGKIAVTFNKDVQNPALTVLVNGEITEAPVTYDAETFTSYIDAPVKEGDVVKVTAEGIAGEYSEEISDEREQIDYITVKDSYGTPVEAISHGETSVTVSARIINSQDSKANIIAAFYSGDELIAVAMPNGTQTTVSDGVAEAEFKLEFGQEAGEGDSVKVFCWKENLAPYADYKGIQTEFGMEDF